MHVERPDVLYHFMCVDDNKGGAPHPDPDYGMAPDPPGRAEEERAACWTTGAWTGAWTGAKGWVRVRDTGWGGGRSKNGQTSVGYIPIMASNAKPVVTVTGYIGSALPGSAHPPQDPMLQGLATKKVHLLRHPV